MEKSKKGWEPINFIFYLSFAKWPILSAALLELLFRVVADRLLGNSILGVDLDLLA